MKITLSILVGLLHYPQHYYVMWTLTLYSRHSISCSPACFDISPHWRSQLWQQENWRLILAINVHQMQNQKIENYFRFVGGSK